MNRKQLIILLALVVVVGGASLLLRNKESSSYGGAAGAGKPVLPNLAVNDIAQISIRQGAAALTLHRKDDLWRVAERNDFPANYNDISDLVLKLRDLKAVQTEQVGASLLPRMGLGAGEGTNAALTLEFKDKDGKSMHTLLLGKKHFRKSNRPSPMGEMGEEGWPDGRYVKVPAGDQVALVNDALANVEPKPEQWIRKDFVKIEKLKSAEVKFPEATNSWKLVRETESGEWKFTEAKPGEQLDTAKASSATSALGSPSFTDVLTGPAADAATANPTQITLETFDGFTYTLKAGAKTNENYPVQLAVSANLPKERTPGKDEKPEDKAKLDKDFKDAQKKLEERLAQEKKLEGWTFLVSGWTLDSVLKVRTDLLAEKKEPAKEPGDAPAPATNGVPDLLNLPNAQ
jgi:hypothetical protein